ncbi:aquaporin [Arthrobacter wenxiniae]|uniref:Porin n=1 Tax=Arthrobacter wenxiniae TaxID=2713570 RepID=A0A7Y7IEG3_9MICC|nr:aquaporin [Arthrobacter wenxiniae]NVM94004.1 porin [Arthrobacter wenxiniae]
MSTSGTAPAAAQPHPLGTQVAIEALGSFFIVFVGLATALFSASTSAVAFGYGLALVAALVSFGNISNGYFNPAFSLAMAVAGRIKWLPMVLYVAAQTIGAVLASGVIYAVVQVIPADSTGGASKVFATLASGFDDHSPLKVPMVGVMIVEIVAAAVLVAVILGATHARNNTNLAPFGIGLALAVSASIALPVGNSALNPAASSAVVFLTDSWAAGQLWLFWLAPLFGAALAAAIYRTFVPPAPVPAMDDAGAAAGADAPPSPLETLSDGTLDALPAPVSAQDASGAAAPAPKRSDAQDFFDAR